MVVEASPAQAAPTAQHRWTREYPGVVIRGSSPLGVDLDGGGLDVVVGGYDGKVYAVHGSNGSDVGGWPHATGFGIWSSPSAADVDGNGSPEVFVGAGLAEGARPRGGMVGINANGARRWFFSGADPDNPQQAVTATAPIGDINSDGTPDLPFGTMGLTMHNLTASSGQQNGGWPFYADDSVFSSAALADVNRDGQTDIVVGGDSWVGGPVDHEGGVLRAIRSNGSLIWQRFFNDIVYSSPAVADLDGNGTLEIAVGNGDFYHREKGYGGHEDSRRLFLLDAATGNTIWQKELGALTTGSPALADVNGDGRRDIVTATQFPDGTGRLFAFDVNGTTLINEAANGGAVIGSVTTADFNSDGGQDILVPTGAGVTAYNGKTGRQMFFISGTSYQNSPLVTDVDGNGRVDIFLAGTKGNTGVIHRYEVTESTLGAHGWHTFRGDARRTGSLTNPPLSHSFCGAPGAGGYWMVARDGGMFSFCDARFFGSMGGQRLNAPIVGMTSTRSGNGYWMVASDGGIFAFGDARFHGSMGGQRLNAPIVGITRTPSGDGYWMVASDGGIFAFGDARFFGSMGGSRLNAPIVAIAARPDTQGYWLVASDGGMFAFNAPFFGSMGGHKLNAPIVSMTPNGNGNGYWLVATDGGIFAFGSVKFYGSMGGARLNQPIVGMSRTPSGDGYRLVAADGGLFSFNAPFFGSMGGARLNQPIVGMGVPLL